MPITAPPFSFKPALSLGAGLLCLFLFCFSFSFCFFCLLNVDFVRSIGFVDIGMKLLSDSKNRFQTKLDEIKQIRVLCQRTNERKASARHRPSGNYHNAPRSPSFLLHKKLTTFSLFLSFSIIVFSESPLRR